MSDEGIAIENYVGMLTAEQTRDVLKTVLIKEKGRETVLFIIKETQRILDDIES